MVEYSVGTKLVCVDDSNQKVLKKGSVYTCNGYMGKNVLIKEYKRYGFKEERFKVMLVI